MLKAGYNFGETTEVFHDLVRGRAGAASRPGTYRNITGNTRARARLRRRGAAARACRSSSAATRSRPASDILHELVDATRTSASCTFQAEDEIAGVGAAIGAAFGGALGVTTTSGPGMALKAEAIGLAVMVELPLVIVDIQRGGPSTGLPTKTEQADLLQALYGRNGESPVPVLARGDARPTASRWPSRRAASRSST